MHKDARAWSDSTVILGAGSVSTRGGNNTFEQVEVDGAFGTLSADQRLEIGDMLAASSLSQQQQTAVQAAITNAFTQYGDYVNFQSGSADFNALVASVAARLGNVGGGTGGSGTGITPEQIATHIASYFQSQAWQTYIANYFAANPAQCGCDLPAFQAQLIEHIIAQLTEVPTGDEDDGNPIYNQLTQAVRDVAELALADSGIASDLYDTMERVTALEGTQLIGDWSALSTATTISQLTTALTALADIETMPDNLATALGNLSNIVGRGDQLSVDLDDDGAIDSNDRIIKLAENAQKAKLRADQIQGKIQAINSWTTTTSPSPLLLLNGYATANTADPNHPTGSGSDTYYIPGLLERAIFAAEMATSSMGSELALFASQASDALQPWNQVNIDTWLAESGSAKLPSLALTGSGATATYGGNTLPSTYEKSFGRFYALYKASPVEEVRASADKALALYEAFMAEKLKSDIATAPAAKNGFYANALPIVKELSLTICNAMNQILDLYATPAPSFWLPNSMRRLLGSTGSLNYPGTPATVGNITTKHQLHDLFAQLALAASSSPWCNDTGVFNATYGTITDYQTLATAFQAVANQLT